MENRRPYLAAFSLVETIIVLLIVVMLTTIGTLNLQKYQQQLVFESAVREVKVTMAQAAKYSLLQEEGSSVVYYPASRKITFTGGYDKQLFLPNSVKLLTRGGVKISKNGNTPPTSISLQAENGKSIKLNFQMTWGRVIDAKG